jgi:hypothetical protein
MVRFYQREAGLESKEILGIYIEPKTKLGVIN